MKKYFILFISIAFAILLNACSIGQKCDICGEKTATKTYENMLGMKMHVCGDCYKDAKQLSDELSQ